MAVQIQVRRGTEAEWTADNPTLAHGELAVELDTLKWKIGDGTTEWGLLPYAADGDTGPQGKSLEFDWDGTNLGVRVEGDANFIYEDISGAGLEFVWDDTQLGVRVENSGDPYQYVDLRGDDGFQGGSGIEVQDEPPEDTNVLWLDTEDPPAYPLPTGGFAGEVLTKNSSDFYDFDWSPVPSPAASNVVFTSSGLAVISGTSDVQAALEAVDAALEERPTTQEVEDSLGPLDFAEVTSGTEASLTLTVPSGLQSARVVAYCRSSAEQNISSLNVRLNNQNGASDYRVVRRTWTDNATAPAVTVEAVGGVSVATIPAANFPDQILGAAEVLLLGVGSGPRTSMRFGGGVAISASVASEREGMARTDFSGAITSIQLNPSEGSFTVGTRVELHRA